MVRMFGRTEFVLQREPDDVELGERRERLQTVERQLVLPQRLFHIGPRREHAFAGPILAGIHQRVEHLQSVVAHADRVHVGKGQAEFPAHVGVVLAHDIQLATEILGRHLDARQHMSNQVLLECIVNHLDDSVSS